MHVLGCFIYFESKNTRFYKVRYLHALAEEQKRHRNPNISFSSRKPYKQKTSTINTLSRDRIYNMFMFQRNAAFLMDCK